MTIKIKKFISGSLENNVILLYDPEIKDAVIVDPSLESRELDTYIKDHQLKITSIWITHAHFDHFTGVSYLSSTLPYLPKIGLHHDDLDLWRDGGGSKQFGFHIEPPKDPDFYFEDGQDLTIGSSKIKVILAPGHSMGSVIFYIPEAKTALCGDVIFYHSIGRTDLYGGSYSTLIHSITTKVFALPPDTRLITGHGPDTSVAEEIANNPFIN